MSRFKSNILIARETWYGSKRILTSEINHQERLIYYFTLIAGLNTKIEVDAIWAEYLIKHREMLKCLDLAKAYLVNPNVPGILDKIEPPMCHVILNV